jgi:hypothetical protein
MMWLEVGLIAKLEGFLGKPVLTKKKPLRNERSAINFLRTPYSHESENSRM